MKRSLFGTFLCFVLSVGMYHLDAFHFSWNCVSTLYTIVGVAFSVGMSLMISVSTREVKNKEAKKDIRRNLTKVTYSYILSFGLASILYILLDGRYNIILENRTSSMAVFKYLAFVKSDFLVLTLCLYILIYIGNFMAIQDMSREIEDILDCEHQSRRP